jgi:HD-GYP domain-containing protein (c-di-GMP phosphodiesterase class II)
MDDKLKRIKDFYRSFLKYTEALFDEFIIRKKLEFHSIQEMIITLCEFVRLDRNSVVYVMQTAEPYNNLHVAHSVGTCVVAMIIGTNMKLPRHQLVELGVAGLLTNISVLNMPGRIYTNNEDGTNLLKSGTDREKKLMYVHPVHACKTLKSLDFPPSVCEAVLQHHELEDGSGFPWQLKGKDIDLYGKILVVAGFYDAFSMKHIDGAKCGHSGIIRILKNDGIFDVSVIRALVSSISIYPVGIYVLLSNGKRGQVVNINPQSPRFPVVKILDKQLHCEIVRTYDELCITRTLTSEEIEDSVH